MHLTIHRVIYFPLASSSEVVCVEEEELSAEVSCNEELSDADQQQQQLPGEPKTPPKSQAPAMPPPPRK